MWLAGSEFPSQGSNPGLAVSTPRPKHSDCQGTFLVSFLSLEAVGTGGDGFGVITCVTRLVWPARDLWWREEVFKPAGASVCGVARVRKRRLVWEASGP